MRITLIIFASIIAGCSTQPKPVFAPPPPPNCINVPGEGCKKISAGNVGGTTLGHHNEDNSSEENKP